MYRILNYAEQLANQEKIMENVPGTAQLRLSNLYKPFQTEHIAENKITLES